MDIQALKLELVQRLVATNDVSVLARVKHLLESLVPKPGAEPDGSEDDLAASANTFGQVAYGENEPDISDLELKEPNPGYGE